MSIQFLLSEFLLPLCAHWGSLCVFSIPFVWIFGFSIVGIWFLIDMFLGLLYAHSIFPCVFWLFFIEFPTPLCEHLGFPWVLI
jgi:hypothetical protein